MVCKLMLLLVVIVLFYWVYVVRWLGCNVEGCIGGLGWMLMY